MNQIWSIVLGAALATASGILTTAWGNRYSQRQAESKALREMYFHLTRLHAVAEHRDNRSLEALEINEYVELRRIAQIAQLELSSNRVSDIALRAIGLIGQAPREELENLIRDVTMLINPRVSKALFKVKYWRRSFGHSNPEDHQ